MTDYIEMMDRADRAMHDVAQLHLHEFVGGPNESFTPHGETPWGPDARADMQCS